MGLKFSIPYQIPFYETDITHQVKLPHLLAFSLQVSGMQSESLGNTDKIGRASCRERVSSPV